MAVPRVAVIGAGMSGLTMARALSARGITYDQFEISDRVGGLWVQGNVNGRSPAYDSLHVNSSKQGTQYSDFPMPDAYPTYPSHRLMASYFDSYADAFSLKSRISFRTEVTALKQRPDGRWDLRAADGRSDTYDAVCVCNGHHWLPRWPEPGPPGQFAGELQHAHTYRNPEPYAGKSVLVVGMGSSALDIAVNLSTMAKSVFICQRRPSYILPKFIFGIPADLIIGKAVSKVPLHSLLVGRRSIEWTLSLLTWLSVGRMEDYGLLKPTQGILRSHIQVHSFILAAIGEGSVTPKPGIRALAGRAVEFEDGSREEIDTIIYATGYTPSFPFLDEGVTSRDGHQIPLFWNVFPTAAENLAFIGLVDGTGSIHPIAERQARWVATWLAGEYRLPDKAAMEAEIRRQTQRRRETWVETPRHGLEIYGFEYHPAVAREVEAGRKRARRS